MVEPRILVFAGSLRTGSFNEKLARAAVPAIQTAGGRATKITLGDYPLPIYDADLEAENGVPDNARRLANHFLAHQGIFIAAPEYNAGPTPLLKNAIDWVSRVKVEGGPAFAPFRDRVFALGAASPGGLGGYRGLMQLRQSLELQLTATVIPEMVSVPGAGNAFAEDGTLTAERPAGMLTKVAKVLVETARRYA